MQNTGAFFIYLLYDVLLVLLLCICIKLVNESNFDRHLSTAEKLHLLHIVRHRMVNITLDIAQDQLVDKFPIIHVCELLRYQGKVWML